MPRFKRTADILKVMEDKTRVRNVGVVAHIDHGKTTMTDSLLVEAGLLSPQVAGAKVLDYLEEEQKRGITIKTANISLLHEARDGCYVVNLVDTPGHVDFTGKVARAMRAIDGAVVVVDAVEEIMAQTEIVVRQALEERVKPVLFINKVDRLVKELKMDTKEIEAKFQHIIDDFNGLVAVHAEPEFAARWSVDAEGGSVAFGSALHGWGFTVGLARSRGVKFDNVLDAYANGNVQSLAAAVPLHAAVLDMAVNRLPSPAESQIYRLPEIWKGDDSSELGRAMARCDEDGPTAMCVTMVQPDRDGGMVATGRLFSGRLEPGSTVYLVNAGETCRVQKVFMYMGAFPETVPALTAGNIAAFACEADLRPGETVVDVAHREGVVPFEQVKYVSEPVVTVAVEPRNPKDLARLAAALNELSVEDPNLIASVDRGTGEYLLSGMGELHLDVTLKSLRERLDGAEFAVSSPAVSYRESVSSSSGVVAVKSRDGRNTIRVESEPAGGKDWLAESQTGVLASDDQGNVLIATAENLRKLGEAGPAVAAGFRDACRSGPLCGEPLKDVVVRLVEAEVDEGLVRRESPRLAALVKRAVWTAVLAGGPVLLEPVYRITVSAPAEWEKETLRTLRKRRGKVISSKHRGALSIIMGLVPVSEAFGLPSTMRSATSGHAFWQCVFDRWQTVPEEITRQIVRQIRQRKGLPLDVPDVRKLVGEG